MTTVDVKSIPDAHRKIRAKDWLSPLVCRLLRSNTYTDGSKAIDFRVRPPMGARNDDSCTFSWQDMKADFDQAKRSYQEHVLTEFATLGLACAAVVEYGRMEVTEVTRRGERADYWLGDRECLLEVSGQQQGDLDSLHKQKAEQLKANPYGIGGYVCVANYSDAAAYFWYHDYEA